MNKLIKTYLGFCIKSKSIIIGQDRLKVSNDKVYLLIYCNTASQNLQDLTTRLSQKFDCKLLSFDEPLAEYTHIEGCKVLGITNKSLADQIIKVAENKN